MLYADTGGFFAKQGLDVEIQGGRGSAMAVQQVIAANVLLSRTGGTDHIKAYAKDPSLVAIAEIFQQLAIRSVRSLDFGPCVLLLTARERSPELQLTQPNLLGVVARHGRHRRDALI